MIVLGNHDYWPTNNKLTIFDGGDKCNAMLQDMCLFNVKVLDMDTHIDGEFLFVGATLWTDMNKSEPLAMYDMSRFMAYDGKIAFDTGENYISRFSSEKWVKTHLKHRDYLKIVFDQNKDKKIVVITHHIPLMTLGDERYVGDQSNAYYMSDLSDLILDNPHIKLWIYGHTHNQRDTMLGDTRLINNCVGYQGEHMEQQGLVVHETIEL